MKLDMQLPYDTAIALLGIYYREITISQKKKKLYKDIYSSFVHTSQNTENHPYVFQWMNV